MARISCIELQHATAEVKHIFEHRLGGRPANVHKAMAHNPHALTPFLAFYAAAGKSLGRRLWEMVYLRVSFLNRCNYCAQHHMASSKAAGLGPDDWGAMKTGELSRLSEAEQTALRYADKLTLRPAEIEDADIAGLKHHFRDQQIADLHLLIGLANLTNRFTAPLGLELEFPPQLL